MKVAIEAFSISDKNTGIGNYTKNLIEHLPMDSDIEYNVYLNSLKANNIEFNYNINTKKLDLKNRTKELFYRNYWLSKCCNKSMSVFHGTSFYLPLGLKIPSVLTIHDMAGYVYPETFNRIRVLYGRVLIPDSARRANKIIAVSNNTKKDIIKYLKIPDENIDVIYLAPNKIFEKVSAYKVNETKLKFNLDRYILCVGTLEPRKNLISALRAYKNILNYLPYNIKLVIVGKSGWLYNDIFKEMLDIKDRIVLTGYVNDIELRNLYNGADVFVYPSLYEGFGLPVLEAMACGTPVITSNTSSLPEVIGDAGIMINPTDIDEIGNEILNVINDGNLKNKMSKKGLIRSKSFTWKKCSEKTRKLYEKVIMH